ncbi:MAG: NAD(P)/FAD-dependent oxidoreductase [bacterium]|nr:NAD(P)/FAD-dependent oxidoreductase [bacterium]
MKDTQGIAPEEITDQCCDVAIIGAGPAGASGAAVLAEHGRKVHIVEHEPFPRYRVGESLIPHCWFPLDRLGLTEKLDASGFTVHKHSVQFVSTQGVRSKPYYFFQHADHPSSRTWQVVRSKFDQLLLDAAVERGAEVSHETAAKELLWKDGRVTGIRTKSKGGQERILHASVTIDASGRDAFAQARNRWRVPDEDLKKIAIWTYYDGALRDPGLDEGATTIAYLPQKGWFWYLPLANDRVSVGIVGERDYLYKGTREPREIFEREIDAQPWIAEHLAPGKPTGEFRVTSDFSYRSRYCAADGLVLAGDALGFLDPVFSSGVFFALKGGVLAGDAIEAALAAGDVSAKPGLLGQALTHTGRHRHAATLLPRRAPQADRRCGRPAGRPRAARP